MDFYLFQHRKNPGGLFVTPIALFPLALILDSMNKSITNHSDRESFMAGVPVVRGSISNFVPEGGFLNE